MGNFLSRTIIRPAESKKKTLNLGYLSKLQIVFVQIEEKIYLLKYNLPREDKVELGR